jgi:adenylate cyclase
MVFKKRLIFAPGSDMTRFYLACVYALSGRDAEARAMWQELMRVNPKFSAEHVGRVLPYRDPSIMERLPKALQAAGIAV